MRERSDGKATREAILEAAEAEFAEHGYEAASTRGICTRAGVNVALVNRYFKSKENLYRIVAKRLFGDLGAPMAALPGTVADGKSWRAAVRAWVDDFLFMTLPTRSAQRRCAALFRQEVTQPTKFHAEFKQSNPFEPSSYHFDNKFTVVLAGWIFETNPRNDDILIALRSIANCMDSGGYLVYTNHPWTPNPGKFAAIFDSNEFNVRNRSQAELDALVTMSGFEKTDQLCDVNGIFSVSVAVKI